MTIMRIFLITKKNSLLLTLGLALSLYSKAFSQSSDVGTITNSMVGGSHDVSSNKKDDSPQELRSLAAAASEVGNHLVALRNLQQAVKLDNESLLRQPSSIALCVSKAKTIWQIGRCYMAMNQFDHSSAAFIDSLQITDKLLKLVPNNADGLSNRGFAYYSLSELQCLSKKYKIALINSEKAVKAFQQSSDLQPNSSKALERYAYSLYTQSLPQMILLKNHAACKSLESARRIVDKALVLKPGYELALLTKGHVLQRLAYVDGSKDDGERSELYDHAISCFTKVIATEPKNVTAYTSRSDAQLKYAKLLMELGKNTAAENMCASALESYKTVLSLAPLKLNIYLYQSGAYSTMGTIRSSQGNFSGAISCFNTAIELSERYLLTETNRGNPYLVKLKALIGKYNAQLKLHLTEDALQSKREANATCAEWLRQNRNNSLAWEYQNQLSKL